MKEKSKTSEGKHMKENDKIVGFNSAKVQEGG